MHHVGDHRCAVVIPLYCSWASGKKPLRGPPACAGIHRLVQKPLELESLRLGGLAARLCVLKAEHPGQHRPDWRIGQNVQRLWRCVHGIQELWEGHPVPRHPETHRLVRDRLDARHREHRPLAHLRWDGRETEAAVPDDDARDAVPTGQRAVGIPEQLRIVMRVEVDESRSDNKALGVQNLSAVRSIQLPQLRDSSVLDPHIRPITR